MVEYCRFIGKIGNQLFISGGSTSGIWNKKNSGQFYTNQEEATENSNTYAIRLFPQLREFLNIK